MLHELRIENVAVIEEAEIRFDSGLNALTGETGAGKSIIIDSIAAVTGSRATRELIRSGAERAVVTAVFDSAPAFGWLQDNDISSEEDQIILQRRISADGKSSCRVNGYPVTAAQMRELGERLLEIHGQNDGAQLLDERNHLPLLDDYGDHNVNDYKDSFGQLRKLQKEREQILSDETEKEHLQIVLSETVAELESLNIHRGEQEELTARRDLLRNSEKLKEALHAARDFLSADEGALSQSQQAARQGRRAASFSEELNSIADELEQAAELLADADESLREFEENLNYSPEEYNYLEQRLHDLSRLERKYRCNSDDLPDYLETCRNRLRELEFSEEHVQNLSRAIERQKLICQKAAETLHQQRQETASMLERKVEEELRDLSMPSARFKVELLMQKELKQDGMDSVRFLLSANKGEKPGRISKIASGGELSRIMLALKNVFSLKDPVPTMIFDEIDTGVSGIAAQRVGEKLAALSAEKQVLCVTHLPQIAVMADNHFMIQKEETAARTTTKVIVLDREGRLREISRLNGGDHITETTIRSADEQLKYAEIYKSSLKGES